MRSRPETSLEPIVLRLPLVYGPRVKGNFLTLLDAVARGATMPFGRIANRRDLLYVGNLVQAIVALIDAPGSVAGPWLAADGEAVSTAELVRRVAAALDVPPRVLDVPRPLVVLAAKAIGRGALLARTVESLEVDASPLREAYRAAVLHARPGPRRDRRVVAAAPRDLEPRGVLRWARAPKVDGHP
jgi:nucleoside-diphosphate-sugar epimerase